MNTNIKLWRKGKNLTTYYRGSISVDISKNGYWYSYGDNINTIHNGEYRLSKTKRYCLVSVDGYAFPEETLAALRRHFKAIITPLSCRQFYKNKLNRKEIW